MASKWATILCPGQLPDHYSGHLDPPPGSGTHLEYSLATENVSISLHPVNFMGEEKDKGDPEDGPK